MRSNCLLLFTKPARPGKVKTRMIGRWTAEQAASLHAAFLQDVLAELVTGAAQGAFDVRVAWALDEGDSVPNEPTPGPSWQHERQVGADLGARLWHGLTAAARDYQHVAAIGSDHPELQAAVVTAAFERLATATPADRATPANKAALANEAAPADVVLGPAADGGYYLIALRAAAVDAALFEGVPWSTADVLAATITRAESRGLVVSLLPEAHDVDDAEALEALAARLATSAPATSPHTRALLSAWGLL